MGDLLGRAELAAYRISDFLLKAGIKIYVGRDDCLRYLGVPLVRLSFCLASIVQWCHDA